MRKSNRRLIVIACAAAVLSGAVALAAVGLRQSAAFFRTPSELLAEGDAADGRFVRIGGLVALGSLHGEDNAVVFTLGDDHDSIDVVYSGVLPSLFREGQCVIAEGALAADGRFAARRILAKHDENYRAPDIEESPRLAQSCGRATPGSA